MLILNHLSGFGANTQTGAAGISFIDVAGANATSVTLPTHQTGDLILIITAAYTGTTAPSLASGYTSIATVVSFDSNGASRIGYKIATSSSETSGTWTNAESIVAAVYRGASGVGATASSTNVMRFPLISSLNVTDGSSWVACYAAQSYSIPNRTSAPTGVTFRKNQEKSLYGEIILCDTNAGTASFGSNLTVPGGDTNIDNGEHGFSLELLD